MSKSLSRSQLTLTTAASATPFRHSTLTTPLSIRVPFLPSPSIPPALYAGILFPIPLT